MDILDLQSFNNGTGYHFYVYELFRRDSFFQKINRIVGRYFEVDVNLCDDTIYPKNERWFHGFSPSGALDPSLYT
jgi:hypothetical protein